MANIHDTIAEIDKLNPELAQQVRKYVKSHSYGLVYENNLPEAVRLYKKPVCVGDIVNILPPRGQFETDANRVAWSVVELKENTVVLQYDGTVKEIPTEDAVVIASYKDIIYPGLKEIDRIERGNPGDPYHMVINAENYHALEALVYAYAGKVDCIYIDPPYNTGAKDWKYNNDYVGQDDKYRHSKWLAFMERRLKLAKKLLNPVRSVMIVTIDEKEYLRLGMLLEQLFPEANIQMISSAINFGGTNRHNEFSRVDEYLFVVRFGDAAPTPLPLDDAWRMGSKNNNGRVAWDTIRRHSSDNLRLDSPKLFYPIFVDKQTGKILGAGDSLPLDTSTTSIQSPYPNSEIIWPIKPNGEEGRWQLGRDTLKALLEGGYVRVRKIKGKWTPEYLGAIERVRIEDGTYQVIGRSGANNELEVVAVGEKSFIPSTQWRIPSHNASAFGSKMNKLLMPDRAFPYPKSLYAVEDIIRLFTASNPHSLIVDFFAGSGTTAHAVMLLNHLDGGHRRVISITNNEIASDEEQAFIEQGLRPYDSGWEKYGIAHYFTWARIKAAISGVDTNGKLLEGNYKFTEEFPMSDGFQENAIFCELTYEAAWPIRLDNAFNAIAPILWMLAGCQGPIIRKIGKCFATTDYYGVLFDYGQASKFCEQVKKKNLKTVFVVTDDQRRFSNMCRRLPGVSVNRLYEKYLQTFEICGEGGLD